MGQVQSIMVSAADRWDSYISTWNLMRRVFLATSELRTKSVLKGIYSSYMSETVRAKVELMIVIIMYNHFFL